MHGVHSRIGTLQLAIGQSFCIDETREPSDRFSALGPMLLIDYVLSTPALLRFLLSFKALQAWD